MFFVPRLTNQIKICPTNAGELRRRRSSPLYSRRGVASTGAPGSLIASTFIAVSADRPL